MKKMNNNNKGFTLVELIIVIAIIAILLALITPNLTAFLGTAEDTAAKANAKTAYSSAFAWATSQRTKGITVPTGSAKIMRSGDSISITAVGTPSGTAADCYEDLKTFFIKDELPDGSEIVVAFGDNGAVNFVEWPDGMKYPSDDAVATP